jgi:hypothetical protein
VAVYTAGVQYPISTRVFLWFWSTDQSGRSGLQMRVEQSSTIDNGYKSKQGTSTQAHPIARGLLRLPTQKIAQRRMEPRSRSSSIPHPLASACELQQDDIVFPGYCQRRRNEIHRVARSRFGQTPSHVSIREANFIAAYRTASQINVPRFATHGSIQGIIAMEAGCQGEQK